MRIGLLTAFIFMTGPAAAQAADWQVRTIDVPARVSAIDTVDGQVRVNAGGLWYAVEFKDGRALLQFVATAPKEKRPEGALPDGRIVSGKRDIARAWLAEPTTRYDHGVLGDKVEAGSLVIEARDGRRHVVKLKDDAVFEDLEPRLADLDGNGRNSVIVVKSYLKRGSALAVIAERRGKYEIVAETPPLGGPHRWLDPAGIADFNGDGKIDIALVRQPHAVGALELWGWRNGTLRKLADMPGASNHIAGTRAINMSAVADFDGDGVADIAVPSFDRNAIRIVSFSPHPREIATIKLPAKAATNAGLVGGSPPALAIGLVDGSLALVTRGAQ